MQMSIETFLHLKLGEGGELHNTGLWTYINGDRGFLPEMSPEERDCLYRSFLGDEGGEFWQAARLRRMGRAEQYRNHVPWLRTFPFTQALIEMVERDTRASYSGRAAEPLAAVGDSPQVALGEIARSPRGLLALTRARRAATQISALSSE